MAPNTLDIRARHGWASQRRRPAPHRGHVRRALLGVLIAGVLAVVLAAGYWVFTLDDGVDDAYALWGAADMVIDYLESHNGHWPQNWDDLRPQFDASNGRVGGWSFSQFQERIGVDFSADADELRRESFESPEARFRVIWAKRDYGVRIGADPNQILCDYFRLQDKRTSAVPRLR